MSKRCNRCQTSYELTTEYWHKDSNRKDGFDTQCKFCKSVRRADLYSRNADAEKALVKKWRRMNKDRARAQHTARRAAKFANGPVESISYEEVFIRDNGICGLCYAPVVKNALHPDPVSGTLDHVLPLSLGGAHTYGNIQLAHLSCNSRKGNRIG